MSINIALIDENDSIANGPEAINVAFELIESHINDIETLLDPSNGTLRLTQLVTLPPNSIEAASIVLTKSSGNVLTVSPDGGAAVCTIDVQGNVVANRIAVTGIGNAERSSFQDVLISGALEVTGATTYNGLLALTGANTKVTTKYARIDLGDSNMGQSATNPIEISVQNIVFFDFTAVTVSDGIMLDVSNVEDGQEFTFYCLKNAGGGTQAIENGTGGAELFAYVDPASTGFVTISAAVKPTFLPLASPATLSMLKVKWMDIGGGTFRFVVLDSKEVNGVN